MTLPSVEGIRKKNHVLLQVYKNAKEQQETISSFAIHFIQYKKHREKKNIAFSCARLFDG